MLQTVAQLQAATGCKKDRAELSLAFGLRKIRLFCASWFKPAGIGYGLGRFNTGVNPLEGCADADAKMNAGVFYRSERDTVDSNRDKTAPVLSALLLQSSPSAIIWRVIFAWVNAIYRVITFWAPSHISQERRKVIYPAIADPYASPSPCRVVLESGVIAPTLHTKPSFVLDRNFFLSFFTMLCYAVDSFFNKLLVSAHVRGPLFCKASARLGSFAWIPQVRSSCLRGVSTITNAQPHFWRGVFLKHKKSAKSLPGNVNEFHGCILGGNNGF
jgi:hypothetical protein